MEDNGHFFDENVSYVCTSYPVYSLSNLVSFIIKLDDNLFEEDIGEVIKCEGDGNGNLCPFGNTTLTDAHFSEFNKKCGACIKVFLQPFQSRKYYFFFVI
jgi:hypothetical protein